MLACIYLSLADAVRTESAGGQAIEILMTLGRVAPVVASIAYALWRLRKDWHDVSGVDLRAALEQADGVIDEPLRARLADGSIRLLRCAWLLSDEADASLDRNDASGATLMLRQQALLERAGDAAFLTPDEAAALLDGADRSIFALTYRCMPVCARHSALVRL